MKIGKMKIGKMKIGKLLTGIIVFLTCGIVLGGARAQSGAPPAPDAAGPKKAEEQFKNIQVLKGIPADQLIPAMQFITASLGVECEFCHVQGAFEKDDKKTKQTARKMMEMMITINAENFDGHRDATAYYCHRGTNKRVGAPPDMAGEMMVAVVEELDPPVCDEAMAALLSILAGDQD